MEEIYNYVSDRVDSVYTMDADDTDNIDPLPFVQDISLDTLDWVTTYQSLLNSDVNAAVETFEENQEFTPVGANLFNMLQNRIIATGDFLLNSESPLVRIDITDADGEPSESVDGKTWLCKES